jgi:hypothetical protein
MDLYDLSASDLVPTAALEKLPHVPLTLASCKVAFAGDSRRNRWSSRIPGTPIRNATAPAAVLSGEDAALTASCNFE